NRPGEAERAAPRESAAAGGDGPHRIREARHSQASACGDHRQGKTPSGPGWRWDQPLGLLSDEKQENRSQGKFARNHRQWTRPRGLWSSARQGIGSIARSEVQRSERCRDQDAGAARRKQTGRENSEGRTNHALLVRPWTGAAEQGRNETVLRSLV